jgi:NAD(P)-dependent dehydrogenase (short-subunit alcohol dehydrogenase family)
VAVLVLGTSDGNGSALGRVGEPEDVAWAIAWLLASASLVRSFYCQNLFII